MQTFDLRIGCRGSGNSSNETVIPVQHQHLNSSTRPQVDTNDDMNKLKVERFISRLDAVMSKYPSTESVPSI